MVRSYSGIILCVFLASHMLNHCLLLISIEVADSGRDIFNLIWRNLPATILLYTAMITHLIAGCYFIAIRPLRTATAFEIARAFIGVLIPYVVIAHATLTRGAFEIIGIEDSYSAIIPALFIVDLQAGINQVIIMLLAWFHGMLGIHLWKRHLSCYRNNIILLSILATLLPVFALSGIISSAVNVPDEYVVLLQQRFSNIALANEMKQLAQLAEWAVIAWSCIIVSPFIFKAVKHAANSFKPTITVHYSNGAKTHIPHGSLLLDAHYKAKIAHLSICGGRVRCSTCRVKILEGLEHVPQAKSDEQKLLNKFSYAHNIRLACQLKPTSDITVEPIVQPKDSHQALSKRTLESREISTIAMFTDLRGFTQFSESRLPFDVVDILNRYCTIVGDAVSSNGGYVDKFIGDGSMSLFGLQGNIQKSSLQALQAATQIARSMDLLNKEIEAEGYPSLKIGIGLHHGTAIVGKVGYAQDAQLTAIGDCVNTASRLESMNKDYNSTIIISYDLAKCADLQTKTLKPEKIAVRGRKQKMLIYYFKSWNELDSLLSVPTKT